MWVLKTVAVTFKNSALAARHLPSQSLHGSPWQPRLRHYTLASCETSYRSIFSIGKIMEIFSGHLGMEVPTLRKHLKVNRGWHITFCLLNEIPRWPKRIFYFSILYSFLEQFICHIPQRLINQRKSIVFTVPFVMRLLETFSFCIFQWPFALLRILNSRRKKEVQINFETLGVKMVAHLVISN